MSRFQLRSSVLAAVVAVCFGTTARAAFVFQLAQVGSNVVATGSGTLNLTALSSIGSSTDPGFVSPAIGFLSVGSPTVSSLTFYTLLTGPLNFGSGGTANATSGSGSEVFIAGRYEQFGVPDGYVSGTPLSDTATFAGTFASLGITPGTYTWNWGTGPSADSLTIATSSVPEPASLAVVGVLPALALRRGRRRLHV